MKKVLISSDGSHFIVDTEKDFHCRDGMIRKEQLKEGPVQTNKGTIFYCMNTSFVDLFRHLKRGAQIMLPKDIATIITESGMTRKSVVADAGTGSGALAAFLSLYCKKVYSFDIRDDHIAISQQNLAFLGIKNVQVAKHDVYAEKPKVKVDVFVLDLQEPWKAIENIASCIKQGGFLFSYNPQITQSIEVVKTLKEREDFIVLRTLENIQRDWEIQGKIVRPKFGEIVHTGFITIARKLT
ncbi:MAG: methyltransferase domain-containing protein [Nanoarchaeota archaeon]